MPRGRHRHSPPLHRLLPPSTVAGASLACAAGAWLVGDDLVQRVLAAGAAAAAITGAVLLRTWDRAAGKRVAELSRARVRDEWRTEERIAELETDVEESREIRTALDTKLRAKRAELARLRSEHAELLRRYATAETERASALEGRRLLAIEAAVPARALPAAGDRLPARREPADAAEDGPTQGAAPADGPAATDGPDTAAATTDGSPVPRRTAYAQADRALRQLARNAAKQHADARKAGEQATTDGRNDRSGQDSQGSQDGESGRGNAAAAADRNAGGARHARTANAVTPALRRVPAAAAVAPPAARRPAASRALGGFDFFGTAVAEPRALTAPLEEDLADVVGDEALAEHSARTAARTPAGAPAAKDTDAERDAAGTAEQEAHPDADTEHGSAAGDGAGEVIDLTAHDETEQLDLAELRSAIS